jgi:hypothetical protein
LGIEPQFLPWAAHVVGVQPQTLGVPAPPQVFVPVQEPQGRVPPQPLEIEPQFLPWAAQVVGVQPQTLAAPAPPQVLGPVQAPHSSVPPQPLGIEPQFLPWAAQVVGVQPQTLGAPAPPQVCGGRQSTFVQQLPAGRHMFPHERPAMPTCPQPVCPLQLSAVQASPSLQLSNVAVPHVPLPVHEGARV